MLSFFIFQDINKSNNASNKPPLAFNVDDFNKIIQKHEQSSSVISELSQKLPFDKEVNYEVAKYIINAYESIKNDKNNHHSNSNSNKPLLIETNQIDNKMKQKINENQVYQHESVSKMEQIDQKQQIDSVEMKKEPIPQPLQTVIVCIMTIRIILTILLLYTERTAKTKR